MNAMKYGTDNHFDKYGCHSMCPRFTPRSEQKAKELRVMRNYVKLILLDNIESYGIKRSEIRSSDIEKSSIETSAIRVSDVKFSK